MDELDLLKKDWKKNGDKYPKVSEKEIYAMLHKKSSSIVKWILIISILEFIFWVGLTFLLKDSPSSKKLETFNIDHITIPLTIGSYLIIGYFTYLFYMNYRKITTTDNVKNLMSNILRTRKTVSSYIYVNLAYFIITSAIILIITFNKDGDMISLVNKMEAQGKAGMVYLIYILGAIIIIGLLVLLIWLFYRVIYGLLLKRLLRNYNELKKIDF
ncbi:MAG TPA: hypothetical protein VEA37_11410 [Flavobacterium sp.]|nr:hypothetical protein [Flavobacterium sp.]